MKGRNDKIAQAARKLLVWCGVGMMALLGAGCGRHQHSVIASLSPSTVSQHYGLERVAAKLAKEYRVSVVESGGVVTIMIPNGQLFVESNSVLLKAGCERLAEQLVQLMAHYPSYVVRIGGCYTINDCNSQSLMIERARMLESLLAVRGMRNSVSSGELHLCLGGGKKDGDHVMIIMQRVRDR